MAGFRSWIRGKLKLSRSSSPRAAPPTQSDAPEASQGLRVPSQSLPSGPFSPPQPSSPPHENIRSPASPNADRGESPAHPSSPSLEQVEDAKIAGGVTTVPSQSLSDDHEFLRPSSISDVSDLSSKLPRSIVDTTLRIGQFAAEVFPPAKAVVAGVIEILKILDVSRIGF